VVRTAEEWSCHKHIVYMVDEMFAIPRFEGAVHVSMLSVG
jgi:hypothetical protein